MKLLNRKIEEEKLSNKEKAAAYIAFKALQNVQSDIDLLRSFLFRKINESNPCGIKFDLNMDLADEIGVKRGSSSHYLAHVIKHFVDSLPVLNDDENQVQ